MLIDETRGKDNGIWVRKGLTEAGRRQVKPDGKEMREISRGRKLGGRFVWGENAEVDWWVRRFPEIG